MIDETFHLLKRLIILMLNSAFVTSNKYILTCDVCGNGWVLKKTVEGNL